MSVHSTILKFDHKYFRDENSAKPILKLHRNFHNERRGSAFTSQNPFRFIVFILDNKISHIIIKQKRQTRIFRRRKIAAISVPRESELRHVCIPFPMLLNRITFLRVQRRGK